MYSALVRVISKCVNHPFNRVTDIILIRFADGVHLSQQLKHNDTHYNTFQAISEPSHRTYNCM